MNGIITLAHLPADTLAGIWLFMNTLEKTRSIAAANIVFSKRSSLSIAHVLKSSYEKLLSVLEPLVARYWNYPGLLTAQRLSFRLPKTHIDDWALDSNKERDLSIWCNAFGVDSNQPLDSWLELNEFSGDITRASEVLSKASCRFRWFPKYPEAVDDQDWSIQIGGSLLIQFDMNGVTGSALVEDSLSEEEYDDQYELDDISSDVDSVSTVPYSDVA